MLLAALALGCAGTGPGFMGIQVYDHFPLDGSRWWDYAQDDESVLWRMHIEKNKVTDKGATEVVTLDYGELDGALLYHVDWSSDSSDGVLIHGFQNEGSDAVRFDPPIVFGEPYMEEGDQVETETGGTTFTSTFVETEARTNHWVPDDEWECLKFEVSAAGGDYPFTGTYWIAPRYAISAFIPAGFEDAWVLSEAHWDSETDTTEG